MKLGIRREAALMLLCEQNEGADAIQVMSIKDGLVLDIAEFRSDWGPERTAAVLEWASSALGDTLSVSAHDRTGRHCGADEEWEPVLPRTDLPPAFEHDPSVLSPGLSNAVLALVLARASHGVSP